VVMNTHPRNRTKAISHTRVTTLVADDSPFMLKILTQIVEAAGDFDLVGTATNGCQALRYVSMLSPNLVLMDIHMPGLNGIQVTRSIKQSEHPPVVILTSSDDSSVTKTTAEQAGADAFVSKVGNLRCQLMGALQNLFGPRGEKRETVGISFQNRLAGYSKQEHRT
jgi:CheY-like chemotaxis protein